MLSHLPPRLPKLSRAIAAAVLAAASVHSALLCAAETNLLTQNPSFEAPGKFNFSHGDYSLPGWQGNNPLYAGHHVADGEAIDGTRRLHMDWAGTISTAPEARPAAAPGFVYELRYDLRTLVGKYPEEWLGTRSYLEFFDAEGKLLKKVWGPDWAPQSQAQGEHPWETITVRGVAPAGAATVGVRVEAPGGTFHSKEKNRVENRHVEVDHFRLVRIDETRDALAVRRFPRLIEPGKPATLAIHHAATAPRTLFVRLVDKAGRTRADAQQPVAAGRALSAVPVSIPAKLEAGDYAWEISLAAANDGAKASATLRETGVFCDESVALPPKDSVDLDADHPRIVRMGRWDDANPKRAWMHWFASEIRVRFNGTSLALRGSAADNGFGGAKTATLNVVIDDDEANVRVVKIDRKDAVFPLVDHLSDGVHTARIFKSSESGEPVRFDGLRFDQGRGLLRPEPLPTRRLEIYGDSVTSGGSASPNYFGYAPTLGRELNADIHVISKGGTGVASSFSHMITQLEYWDRLSCENLFDASKAPAWDFKRWTPDGVLVATGHNDQFNGGAETFKERYTQLLSSLRKVYPDASIFCANTIISAPVGHFQRALQPLLPGDRKLHFAFQWSSWTDPKTAHPPTAGHAAMVYGDRDRFSMADWIEERLGWGLDQPAR